MPFAAGRRGLRGHTSLAQILAKYRGVQNLTNRPRWTEALILRWAKRHRRRTGRWPTESCGAVAEARGDTWHRIDRSLRVGVRGLSGGSSLAQLLAQHCGVRNLRRLPAYSVKQILRWADAHHRRTGQWPQGHMGAIPEAPGETWHAVQAALSQGRRGLPGGSSLPRLLADHRGVRHPQDKMRFTLAQIRAWAAAHLERTGKWPTSVDEPIPEAPEETWRRINTALREGLRGLRGGSSLFRLCPRRCRNAQHPTGRKQSRCRLKPTWH